MIEGLIAMNLACPVLLGIAMARRPDTKRWAALAAFLAFGFQFMSGLVMFGLFFGGMPDELENMLLPFVYFLPMAVVGLVALRLLIPERRR